jgi:hypothetical protein
MSKSLEKISSSEVKLVLLDMQISIIKQDYGNISNKLLQYYLQEQFGTKCTQKEIEVVKNLRICPEIWKNHYEELSDFTMEWFQLVT